MKKVSKWIVVIGFGFTLTGVQAMADGTGNPGTSPVTGVDVVRGAIHELEDELAKNGSQTQLAPDDYRVWNQQFRAALNQALNEYEQRIEAEIVPKLQPLSDRYNTILNQTQLRQDQVQALKTSTLDQLQAIANTLVTSKESIYFETFAKVFPFLPKEPQFKIEKKNHSWGYQCMDDSFPLGQLRNQTVYQYEVGTLGPSTTKPLTGEAPVVDRSGSEFEWSFDCKQDDITPTFTTPQWSYSFDPDKPGDWDGDANWAIAIAYANHDEGDGNAFFKHFVVPVLKDGCDSQLCMALKASDLLLTLNTLSSQVDQPFMVSFSDGYSVKVNSVPLGTYPIYQGLFSTEYVDATLPFTSTPGVH